MTRNAMNKLGVPPGTISVGNRTMNHDFVDHFPTYTSLEVATALCFVAGAIRLIMGCLRLGIISILLSDQSVSAFSTGAAIHVATSQIADLFGWKSPRTVSGPFKLVYVSRFGIILASNFLFIKNLIRRFSFLISDLD